MAIKWRRRLVLAKLESVYGTDPTPTVGENAILAVDAEIEPAAGDLEDRSLIRPYLGNEEGIPVGSHVVISFGVEIAGSGTAGTPPAWGPLLRACGMAQAVEEDPDLVRYTPVSDDEASATVYFFVGSNLHKAVGCRGALNGIELSSPGIPRFRFTFTGLYQGPAATTPGAPTLTGFQKPLPVAKAHTTATVHGFTGGVESVEIDLGQEVVHRDWINLERVDITDRRPTASLTLEAPAVGTLDLFARRQNVTLGALAIQHGTAAGHIVQVNAPSTQIESIAYADSDGIAMNELTLRLLPVTGNDEIEIIAR